MLLLAALLQFWRWTPEAFFGDDLSNLLAFQEEKFASSLWQAWTTSYLDKYRPVFATVIGAGFAIAGEQITGYMIVNTLLHMGNAWLAALICLNLSGQRIWLAVGAGVCVAVCRFALYQVTQVTGLLEGLGFLFFLLCLECVLRTWGRGPRHGPAADSNATSLWLATLWCACAVFTHERYLALALWLFLLFVVAPPVALMPRKRWALATGVASIVSINLGLKLFLQSAVLVGTGGTALGFDMERTLRHFGAALMTLAGFNTGPDYLVGASVSIGSPALVLGLGLVFFLAAGTAIVGALARIALLRRAELWLPVSLAVLALLLLLPAALTIRIEQRWLVQPAFLLLAVLAWTCSLASAALIRQMVVGLAFAAAVGLDLTLSTSFPKIYMVYSGNHAREIRQIQAQLSPGDTRPWALAVPVEHCDWTLLHGRFFDLYGPRPNQVTCIDDPLGAIAPQTRVFARLPGQGLRDVSELRQQILARRAEPVLVDFAARFKDGGISDTRRVSTPTGTGAFLQVTELPLETRNSLIVISGFTYQFQQIRIPDTGALLRFDVAMPLSAAQPASAEVRISAEATGEEQTVVWRQIVQPRAADGDLAPGSVEIDLSAFSGRQVRVSFATRTPGNDERGHWIAFIGPRLVSRLTP